jgi:LCP family protein required for cell wall assembly
VPQARSTASDRAARVRFRRALALVAMTLVVPGSAQLCAGNRRVGRAAVRVWALLWLALVLSVVISVLWHGVVFWAVSDTRLLLALRLLLIVLGVAWAGLFVDAWRIGQPLTLRLGHRRAMVALNGVLALGVAGSLLFGAHLVGVQRTFIATMFGSTDVTGAHDGRFNMLLLGGDSGAGRWGLRPDSMTVASIDATTGRTTLISLPRNMADFPFAQGSVMAKQFPGGFDCDGCYLNGVSTWAGDHTDLFPGSDNPGVDATIMGIEGITGLKINYWAMVNLEGFRDLVDAVGGVELNVRQAIPVGGLGDDVTGYIKPGLRRLNGHDTLWFARARDDSDDYSRMARQKCVMNAMLNQVSPQTVLTNFQDIAKASSELMSTNLPASEVDTFMQLALKAKSQKIATLSLVPPMIDTAHPDIALVQSKVQAAVDADTGTAPKADTGSGSSGSSGSSAAPSKAEKKAAKKAASAPTPVTGGSLGSMGTGYVANESEDLGAAC